MFHQKTIWRDLNDLSNETIPANQVITPDNAETLRKRAIEKALQSS